MEGDNILHDFRHQVGKGLDEIRVGWELIIIPSSLQKYDILDKTQ